MPSPKKTPEDEFFGEISFNVEIERSHARLISDTEMYPGKVIFIPTERQITLSRLTGRPPEDFIP